VTVVDNAVALAAGLDTVCVIAPVPLNADVTPRQYGSAAAVAAQHGYCEGVDYCAFHADRTRKPFIFVGIPIATAGTIGREDTSGNAGACVTTLAAGGSGVLVEHDGVLAVKRGGTVGTDQIVLTLSLDGGRASRDVRLGTGTSYTIPDTGVTVSFTSATLVAGNVIHTWHGTGPKSDATGWAAARTALAARLMFFRSIVLIGDLSTNAEATAFLALINGYKTADQRAIYARVSLRDRLPQASIAQHRVRMTGTPTLTFAEVGETGDTITRSAGSWVSDGFVPGDTIRVTNSVSNNVTGVVDTVTALVLTLGSTDLVAEGPVSGCTVTSEPTLTFAEVGETGDTITRSRGSWLDDGFRVGDMPVVTGTASNNITAAVGVTAVTATVLTLDTTDLVDEVIGSYGVSVTAGESKAVWMANLDAEFETITSAPRIDMSAGRQWHPSPYTQWFRRIPVSWVASCREYQHDLHVATWRKADGPTGGSLYDLSGNLVEWDDRVDGGAGCAARFTTSRTWSNGPAGAFIALSLTRAEDASILSRTHNVAVVNLAENICQTATENFIGRSLVLNDDGTATDASLSQLQGEVNAALEAALLADRGEGPRASKAVWVPSKDDVLNVPEAEITGAVELNLNGTIHKTTTRVRVISGGQA
jgi:hypothetical protein